MIMRHLLAALFLIAAGPVLAQGSPSKCASTPTYWGCYPASTTFDRTAVVPMAQADSARSASIATILSKMIAADVTTALGYSPIPSVFGRTGPVTLLSTDVVGALGFAPLSGASDVSGTTVLATGGTTARSLASYLGDIVRVASYRAKCDGATDDTVAIQTAFAVAAVIPNGAVLEIPQRSCLISSTVAQSIADGHSIHLRGAGGMSGFVSANGSGLAITLTGATASFDASDLAFLRTGSGQAGIGLSVQATVVQVQSISHFRSLMFSGNAITGGTASWAEGLRLAGLSAPVIDGVRTFLPDGTGNSAGTGLHLTGNAGHYLTDAKVTGSLFQGGGAGIRVDGMVQGLFMTGSEAIGNDWGLYATDPGGANLIELMSVTGNHFNNVLGGLYLGYTSQNQVANNQFLHLSPAAGRAWYGILADHSGWNAFTANSTIGAGIGAETFIKLTGAFQLNTITGNNAVTLNGPCIDATDSTNTIATGNSCQNAAEPGIALGTDGLSTAMSNIVNGRSELVGPRSGPALVKGNGLVQSAGFLSTSAAQVGAAGSTQADATPITTNYVWISGGAAANGIRLPATSSLPPNAKTEIQVENFLGNAVKVWTAAGDSVVGAGQNVAITAASGSITTFRYLGAGSAWTAR